MANPPFREFLSLCSHYNLIPVATEDLGDIETPISTYLKIKSSSRGPTFLLESLEDGINKGRYSFIGMDPLLVYKSRDGSGQVTFKNGSSCEQNGTPTKVLDLLLKRFHVPEEMPEELGLSHFFGGAVGYFGYDTVRSLERLPSPPPDPVGLPDCAVMVPETVIVMDHVRNVTKIITMAEPDGNPIEAYNKATTHLNNIKELINTVRPFKAIEKPLVLHIDSLVSSLPREKYFKRVEKALDYIKSGEILQVVLSRRYSIPYAGSPMDIFRRLRSLNPSPYMFYLDFGDPVILGASPEMLVQVKGKTVKTKPIAGTRPRSKDPKRDNELAKELLLDEKERAEHLMLVDLGRNDLGRVCTPGSVKVPNFMQVEKFSHVMHLVSDVKGQLNPDIHPLQALEACFPAGTVSGAPKVRAMEIINELEPCRRGIYAGAVGYVGFNNLLDTAIAIRTLVFSRGTAHIQAGGGIVADSVPEQEYQETVNKAGALLQALGMEEDRRAARGLND